jgi:hypothetical protein
MLWLLLPGEIPDTADEQFTLFVDRSNDRQSFKEIKASSLCRVPRSKHSGSLYNHRPDNAERRDGCCVSYET